jgi:hypothetical protein
VGPRTGLDDMEKRKFLTLPGLEPRPLGRPACSQSLYRHFEPHFNTGPVFQYVYTVACMLIFLTCTSIVSISPKMAR